MAASNGPRRPALSTYVMLVAGMAPFGSATPVSKPVGETFPAMLASGLRMVTAVAVLAPIFAIRRVAPEHPVPRPSGATCCWPASRRSARSVSRCSCTTACGWPPGAVGAVVMATTPAVTAVGAVVFLNDRFTRWKVLGPALVVAGVVAVNIGGSTGGSADRGCSVGWSCTDGCRLGTRQPPVIPGRRGAALARDR